MLGRVSRLAVLAVVMVAVVPATASAAKPRMYNVSPVRDIIDRSALTVAGAAIVEVDHAEAVVTANRREARRTAREWATRACISWRSPRRRGAPARGRLPARRRRVPRLRRDERRDRRHGRPRTPSIVTRFSIGTSYEGRAALGGRRSPTTSRTDEAEPEVLFTASQHAREHLTVEMALYMLHELTSKYGDGPADHEHRQLARDLDRPQHQPGRQRVRHRHRQLPLVAQEPPAQRGSSAVGTDLNRNWGYQWGCCGGSQRHVQLGDLPRRGAVLGARDRSACATSSTRA